MGTPEPAEITEDGFPLHPPTAAVRAFLADTRAMRALADGTRRKAEWQEEVRRWHAEHPLRTSGATVPVAGNAPRGTPGAGVRSALDGPA
jgi:hypothetical protein